MSFDSVWVHSRRRMAILMCALPTVVPEVASSSEYLCSMTDLEYYCNDIVTAMHSGQCMPLP